MRKLFTAFLGIMPLLTFGQLIDELPKSDNGKLNFNEVIQVDSIMQNQLYLNSKQFFIDAFKSAKDVIQMDDKDAGIIIGKAFIDVNAKMLGAYYPVKMWFTIKIQSKEGRFKYEIYDIYYENYPPNYVLPDGSAKSQTAENLFDKNNYFKKNGQPKTSSLNFKTQTIEKITVLKSMIIKAMNTKTSTSKDNW
jgi:hypothetical protein